MARAKKSQSVKDSAISATDASASATANALRTASDAVRGPAASSQAETIARLAQMCAEAADHMARAQDVLFDGHEGGETAIDHLDSALQCLQSLAEESERHVTSEPAQAQNA